MDAQALGPERFHRVRTTTLVIVFNCLIAVPIAVRNFTIGMPGMGWAVAVTVAGGLGLIWFIRRTGNARLAGWIGNSILLALLILANYVSGGFYDPNFGWFYVFPILGALMIDTRAGWLFTGIVLLLTTLFWLAPSMGIEVPDLIPPEDHAMESLVNRVSAIMVIGLALGALGNQQRFAAALLRRTNDELRAEMKQHQEANLRLVHAERMASMGTLAAGVAHEINNPLTYLMANVHLIEEQLAEDEPGGQRDQTVASLLQEVGEAANRVSAINDALQSFSRTEQAPSNGPADLVEALEVAIRMTSNEVRHRAALVRDFAEVPPVQGDRGHLVQVALNLLINAAHAIPDGAAREHEIRVAVRPVGDEVMVEVSDDGSGIPKDCLARVFEPFYTTKPIGVGTGLGLPICKGLVEAMGGTLQLESEVGRGTVARFRVPVAAGTDPARQRATGSAAPAGPPLDQQRLRVLAVDDEEAILRAVRRLLRAHAITTASSGADALTLCAREEYDVILCDLMMPDLSGADFYEKLRRARPGQEERIVFMTGGVFTEKMRRFVAQCGSDVLQKPFNVETLRRTIAVHASRYV